MPLSPFAPPDPSLCSFAQDKQGGQRREFGLRAGTGAYPYIELPRTLALSHEGRGRCGVEIVNKWLNKYMYGN